MVRQVEWAGCRQARCRGQSRKVRRGLAVGHLARSLKVRMPAVTTTSGAMAGITARPIMARGVRSGMVSATAAVPIGPKISGPRCCVAS